MIDVLDTVLERLSELGFYVSQGGLGDMLLTLSSIYKKQNNFKTNIITFADSEPMMRLFLTTLKKHSELDKTLIFRGNQTKEQYDKIVNHKSFLGKAHLPDNLDFYNEWDKNPQKYRDLLSYSVPLLKTMFPANETDKKIIGVGCFGSRKEPFKKKWINQNQFDELLKTLVANNNYDEIQIFGSRIDRQEYPIKIENEKIIDNREKLTFEECFKALNSLSEIISTDTWFKTWTQYVGVKTTVIETEYQIGIENNKPVYGKLYDPGNNIFLKDWGFDVLPFHDIISQYTI